MIAIAVLLLLFFNFMKKNIFLTALLFVLAPSFVSASPMPIVSIGVGNGNVPSNTLPAHESQVVIPFDVYATVVDDNLENYHFRVVKEGGVDGYTCLASDALFAPENQGYASTTLSKDACGFNFNQSVYTDTSFSNAIIATLNPKDLVSFGGFGNYWLILGAKDNDGNRTANNHLDDAKIKIAINSLASENLTSNSGGSSSSSSGSSSGSSGSSRRNANFSQSAGEVLGASTMFSQCSENYLNSYIKLGAINDKEEVIKLQKFLNEYMGAGLPEDGLYDYKTMEWVNKFQTAYDTFVLKPWSDAGLPTNGPTGYVYKTTKRWINLMKCPNLVVSTPLPSLP